MIRLCSSSYVVQEEIRGAYLHVRELGEDDSEKGGALSHIRPTYNLINI